TPTLDQREQLHSLIAFIRAHQYAFILAVDPLVLESAVRTMIQQAALPAEFDCYTQVGHGGNIGFLKPDLAYYSELVARVGVEPDETLYLFRGQPGEHAARAGQAGLPVYSLDSADPVSALIQQIQQSDGIDPFQPLGLTADMVLAELRGNISALFATIRHIEPRFWNQHPDENEWSPIQVIGHLRESERKVQRPRLQRIAAEDDPFLISPPPPPGPKDAETCGLDGLKVAVDLAYEREITIDWLKTLPPEDWYRPARHSIFGRTTLIEMARFTAQHDRLHMNQLCQTLGRCK
ncbi:MAG: DinB family protein, partial [Anaerolineae bacterium]|nr:DinB family protein [Anaerolineae bacterium]